MRTRSTTDSTTDRLAARLGKVEVFGHRLGDLAAEARRRRVPSHWTNLFGVVTAACLVVVTLSGLWLMFFYTPSSDLTTYTGGYAPLIAPLSESLQRIEPDLTLIGLAAIHARTSIARA